jgi:O-succinylbenzoate synthase
MPIKTVDELVRMGPVQFDSVEAVRLSVPMHEPFRISSGEVHRKEAVILRAESSHGFGWGESSAMPGTFYSHDTPDGCERQLMDVLPELTGKTFETIGRLEAELRDRGLSPFVRVAIETAAWEMMARTEGKSLCELFGLPHRSIETGLAIGLYPTIEELSSALERHRPRDYKRLKIKIKRGYDTALVKAVREWYGDIPLFVDANGDYTEKDFLIFQELDAYNLMMFEQPFAREHIRASIALQRLVRTPICFDEGIESVADVWQAAHLDAVRIVNIKLQRVGGYLEAFRILEACVEKDIWVWMGTMPELGIGSAQALVLASHPACVFPTDVEPSLRWYPEDILTPEIRMQKGELELPRGPGFGFEVNDDALRRYEVRRWSF